MKSPKVVQTGLSKPSDVTVIIEDGDIYSPLRKIRDKYYNRANKLANRSEENILLGLEALKYRRFGDRVNALIPKDELNAIETRISGDGAGTDLAPATSWNVNGVTEGSISSI